MADEDVLDLTDLIDETTTAQGSPAQGKPGGHHYWCAECGGFRTHSSELRQDKKLYLTCRECEHETPLIFVGGVWTNEAISASLRKFLGVRSERLLREFDSALMEEIAKPEEEPKRGIVEATKGAAAKSIGIVGKVAHDDVDRALDAMRRHFDARSFSDAALDAALGPEPSHPEEATRPAVGPGKGEGPRAPPRTAPKVRGVAAAMREAAEEKAEPVSDTKAKLAAAAMSIPFLLMGALYALAWRGVYVWPIYYAIQPYYKPWMNEWWFASLSLVVPAAAYAVYRIRTRRAPREARAGWS